MRSSKIGAFLAAMAIGAVGAPIALAAATPSVPTSDSGSGDLQVKPSMIVYTGDGSGFLAGRRRSHHHHGRLHWSTWTATGARGSGFNWLNNCMPSCAQGTFTAYPVALHLWRPKQVSGHLIFTRLTVKYTGTLPSGVQRREVWKVTHNSTGFVWKFPSQ